MGLETNTMFHQNVLDRIVSICSSRRNKCEIIFNTFYANIAQTLTEIVPKDRCLLHEILVEFLNSKLPENDFLKYPL